jgi:3-oxoadipate CoA-transferase alpha subunit
MRYPVIDKEVHDAAEAVAGIDDGAVIMIGGFGPPGQPVGEAISRLFGAGRVRKVICSFPKAIGSTVFDELYLAGKIELELVPQGNLAERIRAAGAGIGGFFTKTGYGTELAADKEVRLIDGEHYVFETPLHADFALIRASKADRWGNLVYRKTARNFGPIMAAAAKITIAEVDEVVALGVLDPENIVTPGIYVDRFISARSALREMKASS